MSARYCTAEQAAAALGVSLETVYAYVSRGKIRSELIPDSGRLRRYRMQDVERLKERQAYGRSPERGARRSLDWGLPVLESALTAIVDGRLYYRGRDAAESAEAGRFGETAAWVWNVPATQIARFDDDGSEAMRALSRSNRPSAGPFGPLASLQAMLARMTALDPAAYSLQRPDASRKAATVIGLGAGLALGRRPVPLDRMAAAFAAEWSPRIKGAGALIAGALILCIDHELNVSSFTARTVASAGSSLYSIVDAGLCAFQGTRHGGLGLRVEAMLDEIESPADVARVRRERAFRGESLAGFGHPLYPEGDPRAKWILDRLAHARLPAALRSQRDLALAVANEAGEQRPNIDFALAALRRSLGLPAHAGLTLFALGRIVGWTAHAIEQSESGRLIRPRARYVGPSPGSGLPT